MRRLVFETLPNRRGRYHIADVRFDPWQVTFDHTHDFPEIFLIVEGTGLHWVDSRREPLSRGCLVWLEATSCHHFESMRSLRIVNLAFSPEWWDAFARLWCQPSSGTPIKTRGVQLGEEPTRECERQLLALLRSENLAAGRVVETASVLLRHLFHPAGTGASISWIQRDGVPPWLVSLVRELQESPAPLETTGYWQRRSGRSPEHLARTCRRYLGCTLTDVIVRLRLEHVKCGMRTSGEKVAALAYAAGFENLGYFYRRFRRLEGCSPKQWEARHTSDAAVPR